MPLSLGTRLGVYEVTAKIGEGGMGEVYQARDTKLDRDVALKVLPEAFTSDPDRLGRFEREAKVLASLNHPNIGTIYGLEEAGEVRALVLELIEGPTLADRIAQGAIPVEEALPIAKQIAEALEAAHEQGVIHRDLKPANIKVREDGTVKVLDFGLAKAMQPEAGDRNMSLSPTISLTAAATQMGMVIGTAAYMAPEQASGKAVDKRADVWAFGVVFYEMLAGVRPFVGDDVSKTLAHVIAIDPDWSALPENARPVLRTFVRGCLEKNPKQRVHDVADVRLAMEGAFDTPVSAGAEPVATPQVPVWRRPLSIAIVVAVVAAIASLAGWNIRPTAPQLVTTFSYGLPSNHVLRQANRPVLAVSPDGRQFAYNTLDGLYLRSMDALDARLLPGTQELLASPAFSPDGQSVVYFSGPDRQLKRVAISGGSPVALVALTAPPASVSWTTDGTIFFATDEGILRVSANGGAPELVIPVGEREALDSPQLLPDGDSLLFTVGDGRSGFAGRWTEAQIVVESLTTGVRTPLLPGSDARYVSTGHLVYALADGLFGVAFDADSLTVVGGSVSLVQGVARAGLAASANYGVSDDGTLVYLAAGAAAGSSLVWVDRTGSVDLIETVPRNLYETPRLSPDGDRLLVIASGDAWVYDLASGRESPVTTDGSLTTYADWTPSGTDIAYTAIREPSGENVWIQPADGSGTARGVPALTAASTSSHGRPTAGPSPHISMTPLVGDPTC
jgi:serine/threonine protein kinase/Tol biopolymer transport system component